jgi:hypothetical protein
MENIKVNSVIVFENEESLKNPNFERVLWIDIAFDKIILININDPKSLPYVREISDITTLYSLDSVSLLEFYEDSKFIIPEDKISQNSKNIRDVAWAYIKDLVKLEPDIYVPTTRSNLIKEVCKNTGVSNKSIYKYLRRYWQQGKIKNALLPNYDKCGAKGKEKPITANKRGRNKAFDSNPKSGINITSIDLKNFKKAINDFYYSHQKLPLKFSYDRMLFTNYLIGYTKKDGVDVPILKPPSQLPTFAQFKYWCNKDLDIKKVITEREGDKAYQLRHRPVLGTSTSQAFGPGSRFQIDATIADVYLVNRLTRDKVLKRVTIYAILDVLSRMVAGIYIGLESPSWLGASMALANAGMDKVQYCKEYGVNIDKSEWPCEHMCELLTADRGELEGDKPDNFINNIGVDVEILPPYRADWKGIIEYEFRRLNLAAILWLPGSIKKHFRERGDKDYRLDAALTLPEFTAIIIRCVLQHNNHHRMKWYDRNKFQIADKIAPIPINLWNWGIKNCTGRLKKIPEDILKLNLMPSALATVTHKGIKFAKRYYTCEIANIENWFARSRLTGSWKVPISYDTRKIDYIYIRLQNGTSYEKCYLTSSTFKDLYHEEVEDYLFMEKKGQYEYEAIERQSLAITNQFNSKTVQTAINLTNASKSNVSDRQRIKSIKKNTYYERKINQNVEAFDLSGKSQTDQQCSDNLSYHSKEDTEYVPPAKY